MEIKCKGCQKKPNEISEYVEAAKEMNCSAIMYVRDEEGTFNPVTGAFWCTQCYIRAGMPLGRA